MRQITDTTEIIYTCYFNIQMLSRSVSAFLLFCLTVATAQICQRVISELDATFRSDPSSIATYRDLQSIQHGHPVPKKCNFIRASSRAFGGFAADACLNETGICQDVRASTFQQAVNIINLEIYERTQVPSDTREMKKWYGPGQPFKKPQLLAPSAVFCDPYNPYRTIDGSCNNLVYIHYGMQGITQRRYLPNNYDNGFSTPKTLSKCIGVGTLPSPRAISNIVHDASPATVFDSARSLFVMQMGQFLAHDLVLTNLETRPDGTPLQCCGVDMSHPNCFPIRVPPGDPIFTECMDFSRSRGVFINGVREQINSQTAFFDLSMVYGVTQAESNFLRTFTGGFLRNVPFNTKLPRDEEDKLCKPSMPTDPINYYCPLAGDPRVNEQPGLSSLHTVFMREHNRLAAILQGLNPLWDDERLFQEARKINIGQWQHIVFNEFLPVVLGPQGMQRYNLRVAPNGYRDTYWYMVDPSIVNSFAAAVLRFGHSLVPNVMNLADLNSGIVGGGGELRFNFFEPLLYHSNSHTGMDHILKWLSQTPSPLSDRRIEDSVRQFLFFDGMNSLDLASLNIQRGRDHGLPGYNWYREHVCGLPRAFHFGTGAWGLVDHEPQAAKRLSQAYACTDDIDLFTGHMTERRLPRSVLGPTGQCLLGFQMRRLRDGDRLFYERFDFFAGGFTRPQLSEIKRIRMSDLFCLNTVLVPGKRVQWNIFFQPGPGNDFIDCSTVTGINLLPWKA